MPLDIKGKLGDFTDYLESDDFQKVLPYLLSGGTGALAGALATKRQKGDESRLGHLRRVLTNAALLGGLAGGGHYLLNKGWKSTLGAAEEVADGLAQKEEGPIPSIARGGLNSPWTALGTGSAALWLTHKLPVLGVASKDQAALRHGERVAIAKAHGLTMHELNRMKAKSVQGLGLAGENRRLAGLPAGKTRTRRLLSTLSHKGLPTLGHTWPQRTGRLGLLLAAAAAPGMLGAYTLPERSN